MDRPSLQEQLDACRKAADAAEDPQLRELAEALQSDSDVARRLEAQAAFDRRFAAMLHDVPVPAGLADRLVSAFREGAARHEQDRSLSGRLHEKTVEQAVSTKPASEEVAGLVQRPTSEEEKPKLSPRRRFFGKAAMAGAALVVLVTALMVWRPGATSAPVSLSEREFAALSLQLVRAPDGEWREITENAPIDWTRPAGMLASGVAPQRWKPLTTKLPGRWIVWDLQAPAGGRAYLVATDVEWEADLLSTTLSQNPVYNSGGWSVGVWRRDGASYALVCEGSRAFYRSLVRLEDVAALCR